MNNKKKSFPLYRYRYIKSIKILKILNLKKIFKIT